MSRMYSVHFSASTIAAASGDYDLFEINPAANKPCSIVGLLLAQSTELGDAAEEQMLLQIMRVPATPTSGSGGSAGTAFSIDPSNAAAGFASEVVNTAVATTTGTLERLVSYGFNIRAGLELWFPPETRPAFINGTLGVVRMTTTVADDLTLVGTLFVEEMG